MLVLPGRVTMLGLSRWAGKGGSDRTVQRLFSTVLPWATRLWGVFRQQVYRPEEVSLLVGEEIVATTAGQHPHGLDRFLARLYGQPVPGLACCTLSVVSPQHRRSFPLRIEQVVRRAAAKAAPKAKANAKKQQAAPTVQRRPGRPTGRTNTPKADGTRTPEFWRLPGRRAAWLPRIAGVVSLPSWVLDGPVGHHHALQMAQERHRHLMSTLRCAAALSFPSAGPYAGRGPQRQYGAKVDDDALPVPDLPETPVEGHLQTCISQMPLLPKECTSPWNVGIIAQTNLRTQARAHGILGSRDLALA